MMDDKPKYKISEAAKILGISVHTMRMYEREGLIVPYKKSTNQRLFSDKDIERLRCIRNAINEEKISIEGIKRIFSLIPCWAIVKCSLKNFEYCSALKEANRPCWTFKHENNFCAEKDCRECEVYNIFNDCEPIKTKLVELTFMNSIKVKEEEIK
ncbi:MerR family transcriptional regulator [Ignavibacterium sp.]|jgi:MerR family transcriptional regulator/heat shock protein HspR|uniref:MerR family transcriptional regulator n=3 Tax=Ignavibacterium TaxID=795750 RepID=UPI0025BD3454|nr:MerR family transcriptional regulator [Ignavibacterium sp.]